MLYLNLESDSTVAALIERETDTFTESNFIEGIGFLKDGLNTESKDPRLLERKSLSNITIVGTAVAGDSSLVNLGDQFFDAQTNAPSLKTEFESAEKHAFVSKRKNSDPDIQLASSRQIRVLRLESDLEKLADIHKLICDQNVALKEEAKISDAKIFSQENLIQQLENKIAEMQQYFDSSFISELEKEKRKLLATHVDEDWGHWLQSSKIAKPLRGGALSFEAGKSQDSGAGNIKKSSWYVSLLKN